MVLVYSIFLWFYLFFYFFKFVNWNSCCIAAGKFCSNLFLAQIFELRWGRLRSLGVLRFLFGSTARCLARLGCPRWWRSWLQLPFDRIGLIDRSCGCRFLAGLASRSWLPMRLVGHRYLGRGDRWWSGLGRIRFGTRTWSRFVPFVPCLRACRKRWNLGLVVDRSTSRPSFGC